MKSLALKELRKKYLNALNLILVFIQKKNFLMKQDRNNTAPSPLNYQDELLRKKGVLGHKGSGYKGKGSINTDATIFNRLRKEASHGRRH